jgi:hypothetical protein
VHHLQPEMSASGMHPGHGVMSRGAKMGSRSDMRTLALAKLGVSEACARLHDREASVA